MKPHANPATYRNQVEDCVSGLERGGGERIAADPEI
jgi:hypothetical protein